MRFHLLWKTAAMYTLDYACQVYVGQLATLDFCMALYCLADGSTAGSCCCM
jgi:hypothetical protein